MCSIRTVLLLLLSIVIPAAAPAADHVADARKMIPATIVKVLDGDTLVCLVDGKRAHVRLIGIDAPESHPNSKHFRDTEFDCCHTPEQLLELGRQSSDFLGKLTPPGTEVRLEFDVEQRDKYGRLLAYVWCVAPSVTPRPSMGEGGAARRVRVKGAGGELVNAAMLRAGMAQLMTIPPNVKRANYFYQVQKQARKDRKGFWK